MSARHLRTYRFQSQCKQLPHGTINQSAELLPGKMLVRIHVVIAGVTKHGHLVFVGSELLQDIVENEGVSIHDEKTMLDS